jgi:diguanylate cyclase (GGDEF)-like protein
MVGKAALEKTVDLRTKITEKLRTGVHSVQGLGKAALEKATVIRANIASKISPELAEQARLSRVDHLTGLPNARALAERLQSLIEVGDPIGITFVDVDRFKEVNIAHGHKAADVMLKKLATRMKGILRNGDEIFRYGGDEFVVVSDCNGRSDSSDQLTPQQHHEGLTNRLTAELSSSATEDGITATIAGGVIDPTAPGFDADEAINNLSLLVIHDKQARD